MQKRKMRLGDILVAQGVLTEAEIQSALTQQKKTRKRLGEWLISGGVVTEDQISNALHLQLGIPIVDLRSMRIPAEIANLIPGAILRKYEVMPVRFDENDQSTLILAMADPLDMNAVDDVSIITNCRIEPTIATVSSIHAALDRYFGSEEAMSAAEQYARERESMLASTAAAVTAAENETNIAPIVQLVRTIIEQAARQRASDIHIEALERQVRVRYRIDGVLSEKMLYDITLLPAIVTRIKIISGMDISEKRKPQDGRMTIVVDNHEYDIRVSTLPSSFGEKIVMRLASSQALTRSKAELGMRPRELTRFDKILSNPNGIILVTGPTGSGKSTTLYTALSSLNSENVNIVTVEDPVEANIAGINQVQVNVKAELTFASALRSILRQDPDIIMIGEIRDVETATIAVQASITGHLVVSTLHTNSASATVTRLIDMGLESFLLADSLVGIIAQRLVRRLCKSCREPRPAEAWEKDFLGVSEHQPLTLYNPVGCTYCSDTGYFGRVGVYEMMEVTPALRRVIAHQGSTDEIRTVAVKEGMTTLSDSVREYVLEGVTTVPEAMKIHAD